MLVFIRGAELENRDRQQTTDKGRALTADTFAQNSNEPDIRQTMTDTPKSETNDHNILIVRTSSALSRDGERWPERADDVTIDRGGIKKGKSLLY